MNLEAKIQVAKAAMERAVRPSDLRDAHGWSGRETIRVLAQLRARRIAHPLKCGSTGNGYWMTEDAIIATGCPWTQEQILAELRQQPLKQWQLCALAKATKTAMSLQLRRMEQAGTAKVIAKKGGRFWATADYRVRERGEASKLKPVRLDRLLRYVEKHQPVKLEVLAEHFGRGRLYMRSRMGKLMDKGKIKHSVSGAGSYRYVLPDWQPSVEDLHVNIKLRLQEVEGGCTRWDGVHSKQGQALVKHGSGPTRVDKVLWTVVHGKKIKKGNTLVAKCGNVWCCTHEHHKQVSRGEAMKQKFQAIGFGGERHGAAVAAAVRNRPDRFTPEQLQVIRTAPLTDSTLAAILGKSKSTIASARSGRTYRDYSHLQAPASPFSGLGGLR